MAKIKNGDQFLTKRSGTQFYHDWKPMWSIIDILYKISRGTIQIRGDFQDFQELYTPCIRCNKMISFTSTLPVFFFSLLPASSDVAWPPHQAWFLPRSTCSSRWCAPVLSDESELERRRKTSTVSSSLPPLRVSAFQSVPLAPCNTTPEQSK